MTEQMYGPFRCRRNGHVQTSLLASIACLAPTAACTGSPHTDTLSQRPTAASTQNAASQTQAAPSSNAAAADGGRRPAPANTATQGPSTRAAAAGSGTSPTHMPAAVSGGSSAASTMPPPAASGVSAAGMTGATIGGGTGYVDPGSAPWQPVPESEVASVCKLDPAKLAEADRTLGVPYAIVRYGKLCHQFGEDTPSEIWSITKGLTGTVAGIVSYRTRDLPRTGPMTGQVAMTC